MKETLIKALEQSLSKKGLPADSIHVEFPADLSHGDFATNVALVHAKNSGMNPRVLAEEIVSDLKEQSIPNVESIEIAGPGFVNFKLSEQHFVNVLKHVISSDTWGNSKIHEGKKILVEHSSPNLFKPFHIGHVMNNAIGESITRLAKSSGADVTAISFPSDISLGVAKAIFVLLEKYGDSFIPETVTVLGDAYVEGTKRYDEDETIHVRVKEIADNLYSEKESPERTLYNACKEFNMSYFESVTEMLGSKFDNYIFESHAGVIGKQIVSDKTPEVFTKSEGAVVYIPDESKKNIHTAVFINSQGNPTYEAKDLGLLSLKFETYNPDVSIFITDYQQVPHFDVVLDAALKINSAWVDKSVHKSHGRMTFKGQKMSSRLGGVPIALDLVETLREEVRELNPDMADEQSARIGIAALKFAILRATAGKNIDFDPDTSLSFEGDSGPYVQYTIVRAKSILAKAKEILNKEPSFDIFAPVSEIEKYISRFPVIVENAILSWEPHYIAGYVLILAQAFNSWYGQVRVVDENNQFIGYHLALIESTIKTLEKSLDLLGISVPEKM